MMVSVCMITYNHDQFLKQAIESVLNQTTNFDFELIIANDNSPDSTSEIVNNIIATHQNGHLIKYIVNTSNIGMMPNFVNALQHCNGKYVALCEGDDYWSAFDKLQIQVDFLETNLNFAICHHKVAIAQDGIIKQDTITKNIVKNTSIYDLAKGNNIHTCSVLYRNNLFKKLPDYFLEAPVGDYFLHLLNAQYGDIHYIDTSMAVYRVHETSYWSSKKQEERTQIWVAFLHNLLPLFENKVQLILLKQIKSLQPKKLTITKKLKLKVKKFLKIKS